MTESLYKYLILYKKLALPGIGYFTVEQVPARLDFANKQLHAPVPAIRFSTGTQQADRHFFDFLSADLQVTDLQAIQQFNETVLQLKQQLNSTGTLVLPFIGSLKKEFEGQFSFQPATSLQAYLPDINAERVLRNETHTVMVGERERSSEEMRELLADTGNRNGKWWIYAIILGVLGIAALIYYYTTTNRQNW
jgi:hypothetical protein